MWLVSSMIISIIKFRFHVQSTAQLNYLLSTIVYVPDSKFTYNVTNALLYSSGFPETSPSGDCYFCAFRKCLMGISHAD